MFALVSGGAGGLGGATCRRLVELGASVVIFEHDGDRAKDLAAELGERASPFRGDYNDDEAVLAAIEEAHRIGTFSRNVNEVGVAIPTPATATPENGVRP